MHKSICQPTALPGKNISKKSPVRVVVNNAHAPLGDALSSEETLLLLSFRAGLDTDKKVLLYFAKIGYKNNFAASNNVLAPLPDDLSNDETLLLLNFRSSNDSYKFVIRTFAKVIYSNNCADQREQLIISSEEQKLIDTLTQFSFKSKGDTPPPPKLSIVPSSSKMGVCHA